MNGLIVYSYKLRPGADKRIYQKIEDITIAETEEVHHKKKLSDGGTHDRENLIALCKSCHSKIHALIKMKNVESAYFCWFFRWIEYNKSRNRDVSDVRASLKVGLQMEQVKISIS